MAYASIAGARRVSGLSSTSDVSDANMCCFIAAADAEVCAVLNRAFDCNTSKTEYHSVYLPKRADDLDPNVILLEKYPVQSITCFQLLDSTGTACTTLCAFPSCCVTCNVWQTCDYYIDPRTGIVELTSKCFDYVPKRAKIIYAYGYATVPAMVTELADTLAAIRAWISFLGGNYDRLNSYSLPEQSYNKGDFFDRGQKSIDFLKSRAEELFNQLGRKQKSQLQVTSGGYF